MITIHSLHKFFNKGKQNEIHVLNNVNLALPEKGMVAIFGRSGCGKTTLLNVIGGLDDFSSGALTLDGHDVRQNTDFLRNSYMGYIFQNYNLHKTESCFDNVADALRLCGMSDPKEIEERVIAALSNVGMERYKNRTPDTLSGGQQQRIAIARAIVKNPRIILADEPTGNLDEANTVMIMDLLKAISRDHLVLLVTHEANLVDHYCDTVIELSDGQVVNIRENQNADGFAARDKNDIYLGEYEKTSLVSAAADIEYYGNVPESPIKLKVINHDGKLYLKIDTPKVQVLDEGSEVKLREGVFQEKKKENTVSESIDMSRLPAVKGERFGKLFTAKSSLKSGFRANFQKGKKGKGALFVAMISFAMVLVLMTAIFGTSLQSLIDADSAYNHNMFYLYTPSGEVSAKLVAALADPSSGIDFLRLMQGGANGDEQIKFRSGFFETFSQGYYGSDFSANGVLLSEKLIKDAPLVAGKKTDLALEEMVITTAVADTLLEKSTLGYITEYSDLVGLVSIGNSIDGKTLRIAGVVESSETAFYLSEMGLARYVLNGMYTSYSLDDKIHLTLSPGETVLYIRDYDEDYPTAGETVTLHGKELVVTDVVTYQEQYDEWLAAHGIEKLSMDEYFTELVKKTDPTLSDWDDPDTEVLENELFREAHRALRQEKVYEWYDYYTAELDAFLKEYYYFEPADFDGWLAVEKGIEAAKFNFLTVDKYYPYDVENYETIEAYYYALQYRKIHDRYPTQEEMDRFFGTVNGFYDDRVEAEMRYWQEFEESYRTTWYPSYEFFLSDGDYIALSQQIGATFDPYGGTGDNWQEKNIIYTAIHSTDPDKTAAFLEREFSDIESLNEWLPALVTPDSVFADIISSEMISIISGLVAMAVILVLLSVCMYFIMRSSLMNRIKEVGIYRAIGVSKKNLVFRFFVEALVLTTLTVFVGYLGASVFIALCSGLSSSALSVFFYPLWLALLVLAVLYGICILCGIAPILSLLRKTPAQILAKYDI